MDHASVGKLERRIRTTDYLAAAQHYLQSNFLLEKPLISEDIKARLLGHWGTCHGINVWYTNVRHVFPEAHMMIGPGHGFAALQAQLWYDDGLAAYYPEATKTPEGVAYICRQFSWPYGFPSHSSPFTPDVILEGGELGYSVGQAYGAALNRRGETFCVLIGDGEMETAALLASLNLTKIVNVKNDARVLPVLHLNSYKISGPTVYGRMSVHELHSLIRGFGYNPLDVNGDDILAFQDALEQSKDLEHPFIIMRTEKGATGPDYVDGKKIAGNYLAHQIPLADCKTNPEHLAALETWLRSYDINWEEVFHG